jgi:hypothetical protein
VTLPPWFTIFFYQTTHESTYRLMLV